MKTKHSIAIRSFTLIFGLMFVAVASANFNGVRWTRWTDNSPSQDKSGNGNTPSTSGATNNQGEYRFRISTSSTASSPVQRQEWIYDRNSGYVHMTIEFKLDPSDDDFDKISIAQNHDDQNGSEGVFSIYQVRKSGNGFVFGVQGDTTEASNGYSTFDTTSISLGQWYRLRIRSFIDGRNDSFENAQLYNSSNQKIWEENIEGGGDTEGYYKVGAYRLTGGYGPVTVDVRNIRFWEGSK